MVTLRVVWTHSDLAVIETLYGGVFRRHLMSSAEVFIAAEIIKETVGRSPMRSVTQSPICGRPHEP